MDKDLLILVQQELKRLIEDHTFIKLKLSGLEDEEGKLQRKETEEILHNLRSCLGGILMRLDALEEGLAKTDKRVEQLEKRHTVDPGWLIGESIFIELLDLPILIISRSSYRNLSQIIRSESRMACLKIYVLYTICCSLE